MVKAAALVNPATTGAAIKSIKNPAKTQINRWQIIQVFYFILFIYFFFFNFWEIITEIQKPKEKNNASGYES